MRTQVTTKGQIVIPAPLRRKYGIRKGTRINIADQGGRIVLRPVTPEATRDLLDRLQGSLKGSGVVESLLQERARDREREDARRTSPRLR